MGVKVKRETIKAVVGRDRRIRVPWLEVVECELDVGDKAIPQVKRKGDMNRSKRGDDVIPRRTNIPFGISTPPSQCIINNTSTHYYDNFLTPMINNQLVRKQQGAEFSSSGVPRMGHQQCRETLSMQVWCTLQLFPVVSSVSDF